MDERTEAAGKRWFFIHPDGRTSSTTRAEFVEDFLSRGYREVVPVFVDELPKVEIRDDGRAHAGEEFSEDYSMDAGGNPNWAWNYGLSALAVALHLREHPPVDEEQVASLATLLTAADDGDVNYMELDDARRIARRLILSGRVHIGGEPA